MPLLSASWEKQWAPTSSWNGYDWELVAVDWPDRAEPVTERWRLIGETPDRHMTSVSYAAPLEAKKMKKVKKVKAMKGTKKTKAKKGTKKKGKKVKEAKKGTKKKGKKVKEAMKGTKKTKAMKGS